VPKAGKQFDGFASTDYFAVSRDYINPANPDIAVGPDDILIVAGNRRIARIANPNSFDTQYNAPYDPTKRGDINFAALKAQTGTVSEVDFDTWLGQANLNTMCPGQFDPRTCIIGQPTVRYDQMHGRFLVAFSVIDTGVRGLNPVVTQPRSAWWVVLVSRYAALRDIANGGTTQVFTPPIQPSTGAVNTNNWALYLFDINRYTTHWANDPAVNPGAYPGVPGTPGAPVWPVSDCRPQAVPAAALAPETPLTNAGPVCLFPTEVRIGLDNDSVILVSPTVDVNRTLTNSNAILGTTGPFAGNRVRVISKRNGLYAFAALTGGGAVARAWGDPLQPPAYTGPAITQMPILGIGGVPAPPQPARLMWDMFRNSDNVLATRRFYTLGMENAEAAVGPNNPTPQLATPAVYYEPIHLRGRTLASYSNYPFSGQTVLIGNRGGSPNHATGINPNAPFGSQQFATYIEQIKYRNDYVPQLVGGQAQQVDGGFGAVDRIANPLPVPQSLQCSTTPCNAAPPQFQQAFDIYVGDSRIQRAIMREGFVYSARAGQDWVNGPTSAQGPGGTVWGLASTVFYDVVSARPGIPTPVYSIADGTLTSIVDGNAATVADENIAVVTTAGPHGLAANRLITISGASAAALNGTYRVINPGVPCPGDNSAVPTNCSASGAVLTATTFSIQTSGVPDATYNNAGLSIQAQADIPTPYTSNLYNGALALGIQPYLVLNYKWQNGHFYAPMFDITANVLQYGVVSPINVLPYFDKLFVGTTSPRFQFPNGSTNNNIWPSLFDIRQGQDRFEQYISWRNPHSGIVLDPAAAGGGIAVALINVAANGIATIVPTGPVPAALGLRPGSIIQITGATTPNLNGFYSLLTSNPLTFQTFNVPAGTYTTAPMPVNISVNNAGVATVFAPVGTMPTLANGANVTIAGVAAPNAAFNGPYVTTSATAVLAPPFPANSIGFTIAVNPAFNNLAFGGTLSIGAATDAGLSITASPRALTNVMATRGGAATDPNFGGLWVYGAFATYRLAGSMGEWGTNAAYYDMSFPAQDPYGTGNIYYSDVPANHIFFNYIQTSRNVGLDQFLSPPPAVQSAIHGGQSGQPQFLPDNLVTRKEMAAFIINAQMDPAAIDAYLDATGGVNVTSFADVPVGGGNGVSAAQQRAIEVMYRRGYTRGCGTTTDGVLNFCPNDNTTRGQMAVFIIRAKMSNVFPTLFNGCPTPTAGVPTCNTSGDNFGLFLNPTPYFPGDTPNTHPFFTYIQKLRELRITNGLTPTTYGTSVNFTNETNLTRGQMATFIVRAFFF
jgi:hypothetical protein